MNLLQQEHFQKQLGNFAQEECWMLQLVLIEVDHIE